MFGQENIYHLCLVLHVGLLSHVLSNNTEICYVQA